MHRVFAVRKNILFGISVANFEISSCSKFQIFIHAYIYVDVLCCCQVLGMAKTVLCTVIIVDILSMRRNFDAAVSVLSLCLHATLFWKSFKHTVLMLSRLC